MLAMRMTNTCVTGLIVMVVGMSGAAQLVSPLRVGSTLA